MPLNKHLKPSDMKIVKWENGMYSVQDEDGWFMSLKLRGFLWLQEHRLFVDCLGTLDECRSMVNEIKDRMAEDDRLHCIATMKIIDTIEV